MPTEYEKASEKVLEALKELQRVRDNHPDNVEHIEHDYIVTEWVAILSAQRYDEDGNHFHRVEYHMPIGQTPTGAVGMMEMAAFEIKSGYTYGFGTHVCGDS